MAKDERRNWYFQLSKITTGNHKINSFVIIRSRILVKFLILPILWEKISEAFSRKTFWFKIISALFLPMHPNNGGSHWPIPLHLDSQYEGLSLNRTPVMLKKKPSSQVVFTRPLYLVSTDNNIMLAHVSGWMHVTPGTSNRKFAQIELQ